MTQITITLDDCTRTAIARILIELINADGVIDEHELDKFNVLKKKYNIGPSHHKESKTISLANAINQIIKADWKHTERSPIEFIQDLEDLASIDGGITAKEAMICLALRYAVDFPNAHVFEYKQQSMRFSSREVIYIEDKTDEETEKLNKEIDTFYENICSILGMYGFEFVYIPRIQQDFSSISANRLKMIIEYLHPELAAIDNVENLYINMTTHGTADFACQIMAEGAHLNNFRPSLLFKISSSRVIVNEIYNATAIYNNFLQLPVKEKGYSIQITIKNFIVKYVDLLKESYTFHKTSAVKRFNIHSFHETLLDFYLAMNNEVNAVTFVLRKKQRNLKTKKMDKSYVKFGELAEVSMSNRELSYYMLIVYLCKKGKEEFREIDKAKNNDLWNKFYNLYRVFFTELSQLKQLVLSVDFDTNTLGSYYKICKAINVLTDLKNKHQYIPYKDKVKRTYTIGFHQPVFVKNGNDLIELEKWVEKKMTKYNIIN